MACEIPVCKRCCFCLPLRYGLLAWGYFKMTADLFLITSFIYMIIEAIMMIRLHGNEDYISSIYTDLIIIIIAIIVLLADFTVTIVFIVGGHKKNVKLISIFYFLSMAMWVLTFLLIALLVVLTIKGLIKYNKGHWASAAMRLSLYFMVLAVQTYFLFLLRSEIIKLKNNGEFRFANNAIEAECSTKCEEIIAGRETETKDV